jgi:putative transposase
VHKEGQRRLCGLDNIELPLTVNGFTPDDDSAHLAAISAALSRRTTSRLPDQLAEVVVARRSRPLDSVSPMVCMEVVQVKFRGQLANRPICVAISVSVDDRRVSASARIGRAMRAPHAFPK